MREELDAGLAALMRCDSWHSCNVITYNVLVYACEKGGLCALLLFHEMRKQALQPNVITCNALISACKQGRMTGLASLG